MRTPGLVPGEHIVKLSGFETVSLGTNRERVIRGEKRPC